VFDHGQYLGSKLFDQTLGEDGAYAFDHPAAKILLNTFHRGRGDGP
jgi:hypothetical protein